LRFWGCIWGPAGELFPVEHSGVIKIQGERFVLLPDYPLQERKTRWWLVPLLQDRKSTRLNSSHTEIYTLSLHDALPILEHSGVIKIQGERFVLLPDYPLQERKTRWWLVPVL